MKNLNLHIKIIQIILTLCVLMFMMSCHPNKHKFTENQILGEWKYVPEVHVKSNSMIKEADIPPPPPPPPSFFNMRIDGFIFQKNGICEHKPGYFKRLTSSSDENSITKFFGVTTHYKIEDNMLKIFDLRDSTWNSKPIIKISKDSLFLLANDSSVRTYVRMHYVLNKTMDFDQVIISTSGCYGSCPVGSVSLKNNGEFIFLGDMFNSKHGYFIGHVDTNQFRTIETDFRKASFLKLEDEYYCGATDQETVTVTFIKNNRIIKTIKDYGNASPAEFYWAYQPIRFLYQDITLDSLRNIPEYINFHRLAFEKANKICWLSKSESFYLWNLLLAGKRVNNSYSSKYQLCFNNSQLSKIATDGQHFTFIKKDNTRITMDIGFNFVELNGLTTKFKLKGKYD